MFASLPFDSMIKQLICKRIYCESLRGLNKIRTRYPHKYPLFGLLDRFDSVKPSRLEARRKKINTRRLACASAKGGRGLKDCFDSHLNYCSVRRCRQSSFSICSRLVNLRTGETNKRGSKLSLKRIPIILVIVAAPLTCSAQGVIQADAAVLQPQIYRDSQGFSGCGIRAVVQVKEPQTNSFGYFEFSAMLDAGLKRGALKAGKMIAKFDAKAKKMSTPKVVIPAPIGFWLSGELDGKAARIPKAMPSDSEGYILGTAEIMPTLAAITAMSDGERMQFAMRYQAERLDRVIAFRGTLTSDERIALNNCSAELIDRMLREAQTTIQSGGTPKQ